MSRTNRHLVAMRAAIVVAEAEVSHAHAVVASLAAQADEAKAEAAVSRARARLTQAFEAAIPRPENATALAFHARQAAWCDEQVAYYESARDKAIQRVAASVQHLAQRRLEYREDLAFSRRLRRAVGAPS